MEKTRDVAFMYKLEGMEEKTKHTNRNEKSLCGQIQIVSVCMVGSDEHAHGCANVSLFIHNFSHLLFYNFSMLLLLLCTIAVLFICILTISRFPPNFVYASVYNIYSVFIFLALFLALCLTPFHLIIRCQHPYKHRF